MLNKEFDKNNNLEGLIFHSDQGCLYKSLYYCGLRRGELRGLQWKDINFKDRTLSITKQINDRCGFVKNWRFSVPKTKSSIRILKMPQVLTNDLKMMKSEQKSYLNSMMISL